MSIIFIFQILFFVFFCFLLIKSASLLIKSVSKIAVAFHLTEFTLSFLLVAFATSLPELFVGISSAINQKPLFSLGNVLGSNIAVVTLIIGLAALFSRGIKIKSLIIQENLLYFIFIPFFSLLMFLDGRLTRLEGGILLVLFFFYCLELYSRGRSFRKILEEDKKKNKKRILREFIYFIVEVALLLISAHFIVLLGVRIAKQINIPLLLFSLFFVALGTSLPELIFQLKAARSGHEEMTLGDVSGSIVINSSLVLGVTALIKPIILTDTSHFTFSAIFMMVSLLLFTVFTRTKKELSSWEGLFLIFFYLVFVFIEFLKGKI